MEKPSLQHLPPEVLQQIAAYGDALDILNLGLTCRQFHSVCETTVVHRNSIINRVE
jgi:hypothetical protein